MIFVNKFSLIGLPLLFKGPSGTVLDQNVRCYNDFVALFYLHTDVKIIKMEFVKGVSIKTYGIKERFSYGEEEPVNRDCFNILILFSIISNFFNLRYPSICSIK